MYRVSKQRFSRALELHSAGGNGRERLGLFPSLNRASG